MIYYIVPIGILLLSLPNYPHKYNKILFRVSSLTLFIFCSFRGNGNGDYFTYIEYSKAITSLSDVMNFSFPMEIGFRILSYISNLLSIHQQVIIFFMAMISVGLTYKVINKHSLDKNLSLIVYFPIFLMMDMHASRTAISAILGLIAIISFIEKKQVLALIFFILALSFHSSSIILIFSFITYLPIYVLFLLLILVIIFSLSIGIVGLVSVVIDWISNPILTYKFYNYLSNEDYAHSLPLYDPRILWPIIVSFSILGFIDFVECKKLKKLFKFYIVGTILFVFLSDLAIFAVRLSHFYMVTALIVIPNLCVCLDNKFRFNDSKFPVLKWMSSNYYTAVSFLILIFGYVEYKVFI